MNFSMYSNTIRLFNVNRPQTGDHLGCLDGLRIISMTWVVLGHSFSNINGTAAITNTAFEAPLVCNLSKWPFKFQKKIFHHLFLFYENMLGSKPFCM